MFHFRYFPDEYVEDVYSIDYQRLKEKGIKGLIFDIDNTLVAHGADSTPEVDSFLFRLKDLNFKIMLLSNNSEERIIRFTRNTGISYIHDSGKPSPAGFLKAVKEMGLNKEAVIMIGDTIFTDILGANRAGIYSILVKYIGYYKKERKGIKRGIEKWILKIFKLTKSIHK